MNYLTLENINKRYGEKLLFENLSLHIDKGNKIALVAKNGSGKSTLMRIITDVESSEGENAKILLRKDVRIAFLQQDPKFRADHNVLDAVLASDDKIISAVKAYKLALTKPEEEDKMTAALAKMDEYKAWDMESRIKEILFKFNIHQLDQMVDTLSGGQQKRLALARLIIEEPEFLILDEPTNHLDIEMIEYLENYLSQSNITLFMVTHDRYFLERVCNHIIELDDGILYRYKGNYSDFLEKKSIREEVEARTLGKTKKLFKRELDWIRRQPKARGTKAKSRVDGFGELKDKVTKKVDNDKMLIEIKGSRLGSKILEAEYISKSYDGKPIVKDFFYKFKKKERVGIVGPNGAGKTTFLKLLTKQIRPDSGKVVVGGTIVFGYYTQDGIQLKDDKRVIDVIRDIAEYIPLDKGQKLSAAAVLERFLFSRKQQQVFVSQLSGGERRRLYLLTVLMTNPNFLILDEPTNDLDIVTLNILEDFLLDFPGCLIIVTHDRYFMDKLVDHLFIFEGEGKIKDYNGNYSDYRVIQKAKEQEDKRAEKSQIREEKKAQKQEQEDKTKMTYEQRKEFNRLEKEISKLEQKKKDIHEKFTKADITQEDIKSLSAELKELEEKLEDKEMRWLELGELG